MRVSQRERKVSHDASRDRMVQRALFSLIVILYYSILLYSDVCTKYQEASKIVNLCLEGLVAQCIPGAKIVDLCQFGTTVMEAQASKLYAKKVGGKVVERGVAFPVCISVNDVVCNHSPLSSEELVRF
jgi:methionine aminopeptidase